MSRLLTDPKEQSGGWYIAQEEADAQLTARESVWQPRRRVALLEYTAAPPEPASYIHRSYKKPINERHPTVQTYQFGGEEMLRRIL